MSRRCRLLEDVDVLPETVDVELLRVVDDDLRRFRVDFVVLLVPAVFSEDSIEWDDSEGRFSFKTILRSEVNEVVCGDLDFVF